MIVLGAGASAAYGYPVAAGFCAGLEKFAQELGDGQSRIQKAVLDTVSLLKEHHFQTLDELVYSVMQRALDLKMLSSIENYSRRLRIIHDAKVATAAYFMSLEGAARTNSLSGYRSLVHRTLGGADDLFSASRSSGCRILSFNYDRLFEIALFRLRGMDHRYLPYGKDMLNAGLSHAFGDEFGFRENGFCLAKLHGSVGVRIEEQHGRPKYSFYDDVTAKDSQSVPNDLMFFGSSAGPFRGDNVEPLIVFPWEKDFVLGGNSNKLPYRSYLESVWRQAELVMSSASEVRFIGFSFAAMDIKWTLSLLKCVTSGTRVLVQNLAGEAEALCRRLLADHGDLRLRFEPLPQAF